MPHQVIPDSPRVSILNVVLIFLIFIQIYSYLTGKFDLPSKLLIRRIRDAKHFAIPTLDIQVNEFICEGLLPSIRK